MFLPYTGNSCIRLVIDFKGHYRRKPYNGISCGERNSVGHRLGVCYDYSNGICVLELCKNFISRSLARSTIDSGNINFLPAQPLSYPFEGMNKRHEHNHLALSALQCVNERVQS